jgi:hypothetical protein
VFRVWFGTGGAFLGSGLSSSRLAILKGRGGSIIGNRSGYYLRFGGGRFRIMFAWDGIISLGNSNRLSTFHDDFPHYRSWLFKRNCHLGRVSRICGLTLIGRNCLDSGHGAISWNGLQFRGRRILNDNWRQVSRGNVYFSHRLYVVLRSRLFGDWMRRGN